MGSSATSIKVDRYELQKATGINVGSENNKSRHPIGTEGDSSQIIISANREHQAQENGYTSFFFVFWYQSLGFWQVVYFPLVLF